MTTKSLSAIEKVIGFSGHKSIRSVNYLLNLFAFTGRIFHQLVIRPKAGRILVRRIIVQQIYFTAVQALPVIIPIALLIGSLVIIQFSKLSGQYDFGRIMVLLIVRELGPVITALIVILRTATAVTIEISYMQVLHEIDSLEMMGINPVRVVCLPRLIGITSAIVGLFLVFTLVSIFGGYTVGWMIAQVPSSDFLFAIANAITPLDLAVGLLKSLIFGNIITVISLYHGFENKRRITELPMATSKSVMACFFFCLVVNVLISLIFYL